MSKPKDILNKLQTKLKDHGELSAYAKGGILKGIREGLINYPCVILEPLRIAEIDDTYPRQQLTLSVAVSGFFQTYDKDTQLDELFDFENLVKKAISADRRLDETVTHIEFAETVYEFELFPVRNFTIEIHILFEQISTTRT